MVMTRRKCMAILMIGSAEKQSNKRARSSSHPLATYRQPFIQDAKSREQLMVMVKQLADLKPNPAAPSEKLLTLKKVTK